MPAESPDVSILIPVFNTAGTLPRAAESLLRQSWHNIEIIIINDASPDNAAEVIADLSSRDPRIRPVTLPRNMGTFAARIAGLHHCRGRYVMNLDADDTLDADAVKTLLEIAKKSGADAVGFGAREVTPAGERLDYGDTLDSTPFTLENGDIFDALFCQHAFSWSLCLKMIDRKTMTDAVDNSGISPEMYVVFADDFLQFVPVARNLKKFVMSGKIFYNYYQEIGITGSRKLDRAAFARSGSMLDALTAVKKYLTDKGIFEKYSKSFAVREREQIAMLADRYHSKLPEPDKEAVLSDLCSRYANAGVIKELLSSPQNAPQKTNKLRHLFKTESKLWYLLKKLQGRIKFRKGKLFYEY